MTSISELCPQLMHQKHLRKIPVPSFEKQSSKGYPLEFLSVETPDSELCYIKDVGQQFLA